eukprot:6473520-Amphidinium_carterae.1
MQARKAHRALCPRLSFAFPNHALLSLLRIGPQSSQSDHFTKDHIMRPSMPRVLISSHQAHTAHTEAYMSSTATNCAMLSHDNHYTMHGFVSDSPFKITLVQ